MPTRRNATRRTHATLERDLESEGRRYMVRTAGISHLLRTGVARRVPHDPRAPLGTPLTVIDSRYHRPGSHRHGSRHLNRLRRLSDRMNRRQTARNQRLANYRPATANNNVSRSVEAVPFNELVELRATPAGRRPKRERMNQLPVARAVSAGQYNTAFERVQGEGPESNLFLSYQQHGPELHRRRSRSRSRTSRRKRRPRSASQPRRPRSASR